VSEIDPLGTRRRGLDAFLEQKVAEYERLKDFNENIVESTKGSKRVTCSRPAPTPTRSSPDARRASNASRAAQTLAVTWLKSTKTESRRCARQSRDGRDAIISRRRALDILGHG